MKHFHLEVEFVDKRFNVRLYEDGVPGGVWTLTPGGWPVLRLALAAIPGLTEEDFFEIEEPLDE